MRFFKKFLQKKAAKRRQQQAKPIASVQVEKLEARALMAADIFLSAGF